MFPDLFSIGPLTIHTYGFFVAIGFIVAILVAIKIGEPLGITKQQIMDMGFIIILSGMIGSRIAYVFMNYEYYVSHPMDILRLWQGGLVFSGGLIAVILVMIWYLRRNKLNLWTIADIWAPAAAIGQAIGRIGCFMAGCCYGKPTGVLWAVTFTDPRCIAPINVPRHPTQLYSSLSGIIIFIILMILTAKKKFEGRVFLWFLILHSTGRLLIERFRGDDRGFVFGGAWTTTQLLTIIILIAAVVALFVLTSRDENENNKI